MRRHVKLAIILTLLGCMSNYYAQSQNWDKMKWLIGDWVGEGGGKPGEGIGFFTLKEDLSGKVLVRKNHAEYPASGMKPSIIHDDLLIVYSDSIGNQSKAIYFDNEGNVINYSLSATDNTCIFVSQKVANRPIFRLTYLLINKDTINIKFEISRDAETFITYTTGRCKRRIQ